MKISRTLAHAAFVVAALVPLVVACAGETEVIGNDDVDSGDSFLTPDATSSQGQPTSTFEAGSYPSQYDSSPQEDSTPGSYTEAGEVFDAYEPFDVWNYDAANWPSTATLGCTSNGDECSCDYTVQGHDYSYRCSDFTATCNCMIDGVVEATVLGSTVCAPSDAATSPLLTTWVVLCDFPQ